MRHLILFLFIISSFGLTAQDSLNYTKTEIIYGRRDGMALTMVVMTPKQNKNGKAIISVLSGNWVSAYRMMEAISTRPNVFTEAGYTVFGVMVGSQPRYAIPEEIEDLKRSVRYVRYNAKQFGIDAEHIGITGSSSGGHLSLMIATADDKADVKSPDPVDKVSARVQAAAVFFPPTDFLNYGRANSISLLSQGNLAMMGVAGAFDFKIFNDTTRTYVPVSNFEKKVQIARDISPINAVSADDPPVMIVHGNKDGLVPLQQSESIVAKFKEVKVPTDLIIKDGGGHGWRNREVEEKKMADWFDKYLK